MPADVSVAQWQEYDGDDWWRWAVWLEGPDETLDQIDLVEWTLHPTFPEPVRRIRDRASRFRLETAGWGVFTIHARLVMKGGSERKLRHQLKLNYPDGTPTTA